MLSEPTYFGLVKAVTGSTVSVRQSESVSSGLIIIGGTTYKVGQVGSFVRIPQGYQDLFGIVSEVGVSATPEGLREEEYSGERWMTVHLVGEAVGQSFERGLSQHPNVNDEVHIVTEGDLHRIYGQHDKGQIPIGRLSSAESMTARIELEKLITRHSAVLGSTGSGKSTTVASLIRSITMGMPEGAPPYPSARIILLDIHGEYSNALADVANVFRIEGEGHQFPLYIPYWALDPVDLQEFLFGRLEDKQATYIFDKITDLKRLALTHQTFPGLAPDSLTSTSPIPYSLKKLWLDLIDFELRTFEGQDKSQIARIDEGDVDSLRTPRFKPHAMGSSGPFLNNAAMGIRRHLEQLRSRMLDRLYDFLLHPGAWEPDQEGRVEQDLDNLLQSWLGQYKPITILDLSGVPSSVLTRLIGAILKIIYEAMFWSREKSEGARERPLLVVMEEAHRYLSGDSSGPAREMVERIVKEGRKYGIGAMLVSQRPSEIDETILSQCGTVIALRLSNPSDRARVQGTLPDSLAGLMDMLPVLRTGEAIVTGEAARMPIRCRVLLPDEQHRPDSEDPRVIEKWTLNRKQEDYARVVASWRAQNPRYSEKMEREYVASSNVLSIGYDAAAQTLEVEFRNGSVYQYYNVPENIHEEFMRAPSKGQFINYQIKNAYPFSRI